MPLDEFSTSTGLRDRLLRRWQLVLLGLVATLGLCVAAALVKPVTYKAEATILMTPPPSVTGPLAANPYLQLSGFVPFAAVVQRAMTTGSTLDALHREGFSGDYTVTPLVTPDNVPILTVDVDAPSSAAALKDIKLAVATAAPTLLRLQATVPANQRVTAQSISLPKKGTVYIKGTLRTVIAAGVVGLGGTALFVAAIDALLIRRRKADPREARAEDEETVDRRPRRVWYPPRSAAAGKTEAPRTEFDRYEWLRAEFERYETLSAEFDSTESDPAESVRIATRKDASAAGHVSLIEATSVAEGQKSGADDPLDAVLDDDESEGDGSDDEQLDELDAKESEGDGSDGEQLDKNMQFDEDMHEDDFDDEDDGTDELDHHELMKHKQKQRPRAAGARVR